MYDAAFDRIHVPNTRYSVLYTCFTAKLQGDGILLDPPEGFEPPSSIGCYLASTASTWQQISLLGESLAPTYRYWWLNFNLSVSLSLSRTFVPPNLRFRAGILVQPLPLAFAVARFLPFFRQRQTEPSWWTY